MVKPWTATAVNIAVLAIEAQQVIALRLLRLAGATQSEFGRMVLEKPFAAVEASLAAVRTMSAGGSAEKTINRTVGVYRKRVRANRRRLARRKAARSRRR
jgi:hypothetical protein